MQREYTDQAGYMHKAYYLPPGISTCRLEPMYHDFSLVADAVAANDEQPASRPSWLSQWLAPLSLHLGWN